MKEVLSNAMKMYDVITGTVKLLKSYNTFTSVREVLYEDSISEVRFYTNEGTFVIQFITYDYFQIFDYNQLINGVEYESDFISIDGYENLKLLLMLLARELDI